ncbi:hypothetical protein Glove_139g316 [Diversispora epigaea]|uniref:Uncharacterized protein n=1 Tax=Diversispora epigaea TaxID=1348612 RepID=A0A397J1V5_9GLOM|nr:hypothetical protein Glove_139g316 [Diversispora epigaea]
MLNNVRELDATASDATRFTASKVIVIPSNQQHYHHHHQHHQQQKKHHHQHQQQKKHHHQHHPYYYDNDVDNNGTIKVLNILLPQKIVEEYREKVEKSSIKELLYCLLGFSDNPPRKTLHW